MKDKVLLVEDDIQLNLVISEFFTIKGYEVLSIYDGLEAVDVIDLQSDIILHIIDINLPTYSGLDLLKYIRSKDILTPVIMITASLEIQNFLDAFDCGCSDYIKKPFHIKELQVRVDKLLQKQAHKIYLFEELYYESNKKTLFYKMEEIILRNQEQKLLEILIQNLNRVVPTEVICEFVWEDEERESYPLRQLLTEVRKKLPFELIKTKVKQGYMIESRR